MKLFVTLPALALALVISSSALAENGVISKAQLSEMGLAGVQMMSDEAAMEVRGMGYSHGHKSFSVAFGLSYAKIETGDTYLGSGDAGTIDGYLSFGNYLAGGEHGSVATVTKTYVKEEVIPFIGTYKTTVIKSLSVGAGGSAKSYSL